MRCPYCGEERVTTIKRWEAETDTRRLRECSSCGRQFSTRERAEATGLVVLKRDRRREEFDRLKLARSIEAALAKRPVPPQAVEAVVDRVSARLLRYGQPEVPSQSIGEFVLDELRRLDEVAYIRFASYFHPFPGAGELVEEVAALQRWRERTAQERLQLALDFESDQPHWS